MIRRPRARPPVPTSARAGHEVRLVSLQAGDAATGGAGAPSHRPSCARHCALVPAVTTGRRAALKAPLEWVGKIEQGRLLLEARRHVVGAVELPADRRELGFLLPPSGRCQRRRGRARVAPRCGVGAGARHSASGGRASGHWGGRRPRSFRGGVDVSRGGQGYGTRPPPLARREPHWAAARQETRGIGAVERTGWLPHRRDRRHTSRPHSPHAQEF